MWKLRGRFAAAVVVVVNAAFVTLGKTCSSHTCHSKLTSSLFDLIFLIRCLLKTIDIFFSKCKVNFIGLIFSFLCFWQSIRATHSG